MLVAEIVKTQRNIGNLFAHQRHGGLQIVALGTTDPQFTVLNGSLHLDLAVFDDALDFFAQLGFDAIPHLDDLLDLVTTHFLHIALVEKTHIDIAFGELVAQDVFNLGELKISITNQRDLFVFEFNGSRCALEVKACGDLFGGVFNSVFDVHHVGFANGIKGWHMGSRKMFDNCPMLVEKNTSLQALNSFHIAAKAQVMVHVRSENDVLAVLSDPQWAASAKWVLGGGSNIVLTGDVKALVLKVAVPGRRVLPETAKAFRVEAGAGENWHEFVRWTLDQGYPGLENLALIPGTVGAAPVQNIGAYGVELQDLFDSLDAIDLQSGQLFTLNAAQCAFGYRDSIFKHSSETPVGSAHQALGLKDRALILRVRFALPKLWKPVLGYADIDKKMLEQACPKPTAMQLFDWVCAIRRSKLPDPDVIGNVGSFFKNPSVSPEQCADIIARDPKVVHYPLPDGSFKLAAGWLIDACGWRGKSVGQAGVYEKQALVLVNRGTGCDGFGATGGEVMTLAKAIQTSVYERFGILLEIEPVVV